MKTCTKCKETKPLECFGKHSITSDGLRSECKQCKTAARKAYRQTSAGQAARRRDNQQNKARWNKNYNERHRDKYLARKSVENAIKSGTLIKPDLCETCKTNKAEHAHHSDYNKRLDITWICQSCHLMLHRP
jgi:hypothetical protein